MSIVVEGAFGRSVDENTHDCKHFEHAIFKARSVARWAKPLRSLVITPLISTQFCLVTIKLGQQNLMLFCLHLKTGRIPRAYRANSQDLYTSVETISPPEGIT